MPRRRLAHPYGQYSLSTTCAAPRGLPPCLGRTESLRPDIEALMTNFFMAEFHERQQESWQKNDIAGSMSEADSRAVVLLIVASHTGGGHGKTHCNRRG